MQFKPGVDELQRAPIRAAHATTTVRRYPALDMERLTIPSTVDPIALARAFLAHPEVEAAQPNFTRRAVSDASPNDPYYVDGSLWGLLKINAPGAWSAFGPGSDTVVVADIDTGVDYNHPDLSGHMWRNPGEIAGNGVDDDQNGYVDDVFGIDPANNDSDPADDHWHGTHTSGTLGAVSDNSYGVAGVASNIKVLSCKFITSQNSGSDADAIECFNYVVALKQQGVNIRVTSNSWGGLRGGFFPSALKNAIDAAGNAGILNVFAAGNDGVNIDVSPFDPASFTSPSIVAVAASDSNDGRAGWSNYGAASVDLAAPGVNILSTYLSGSGSFAWASGTSMATPHVAGVAALLLANRPGLGVSEVKDSLLNGVDKLAQWDGVVASGGRLNAYQTMAAGPVNGNPTVTLTNPSSGQTFTAPADITVTATASDSDGSIQRVDFLANGTIIGSSATAPYSYDWSGVGAGTYALTSVAIDDGGAQTTSAAVTIQVGSPANAPPQVTLLTPADGSSVVVGTTVNIAATASDSDGISRVDFYADSTLIGSASSSPFGVQWHPTQQGTDMLTARAFDTTGNSNTSAAVRVHVRRK